MKRNGVNKLLFGLATLFIGISTVKATTCDDINMIADADFKKGGIATFSYTYTKNGANRDGGDDYTYYKLKDQNSGKYFASFCRNAGYGNGQIGNNTTKFTCKQSVYNDTDSDQNRAYALGILSILKNGANTSNADNVSYVATTVALRSYEMLWENINTNKTYSGAYANQKGSAIGHLRFNFAHTYYTNLWLNEFDFTGLQNWIVSKSKYTNNTEVGTLKSAGFNISGVEDKARTLVKGAIEAAKKYNQVAKLSIGNAKLSQIETSDNNSGTTTRKRSVTYDLTLENFNSNGAFVRTVFNCQNCAENGVTTRIYLNGSSTAATQQELDNLLTSRKNNKVSLAIEFTTSSASYDCDAINYDLKFEYKDDTISVEAFEMNAEGMEPAVNAQGFYTVYNTEAILVKDVSDQSNNGSTSSTGNAGSSIELCNLTCKDYEKRCKNGNSSACTTVNKQYHGNNGVCIECTTNVSNTKCTSSDTTINIGEGYEKTAGTNSCTESTKKNFQACIINGTDASGKSYEATKLVNNNAYCSLWCDESFKINVPGYVNDNLKAGGKWKLEMDISGTKTCYLKVDQTKYKWDLNVNAGNTTKQNQINAQYNSCFSWVNNMSYNFNPTVNYSYEDEFMDSIVKAGQDKLIATNESPESPVIEICEGQTNDEYTNCRTVAANAISPNGNITGMIVTMKASKHYQAPRVFVNVHASGSIVINSDSSEIENGTMLNAGELPLSPGTYQGKFDYKLKISDLGEYYDSGKLGRIWGADDSVVNTILLKKQKDKCYTNGALNSTGYVCKYDVGIPETPPDPNCPPTDPNYPDCEPNTDPCIPGDPDCPVSDPDPDSDPDPSCPDCPVDCDEGGCYYDDPKCLHCPVECDNCLFNNGKLNVDYRPINPNDVNPNDREMGVNWKWDDNINTSLELKAYATTEEIENNGSTIYDVDFNSNNSEAIKVTLDSKMIQAIKKYNEENEDKGGYLNDSLKCYDYTNSKDGQTYENVYCYSTFIDSLLYNKDLKDKITVPKNRIIGTDASSTNNLRNGAKTQNSGYWTVWTEVSDNNINRWKIDTTRILEISQKNYGTKTNNVGPSWK